MSQNLGWVLLSGMMEIDRYPEYNEKIIIRTWLSKYKSIRGTRENIIYDEHYNIIGKAKGLWLFFDIEKRIIFPDGLRGTNTKNDHMAVGDINGDGFIDIVTVSGASDPYYVDRDIQILISRLP